MRIQQDFESIAEHIQHKLECLLSPFGFVVKRRPQEESKQTNAHVVFMLKLRTQGDTLPPESRLIGMEIAFSREELYFARKEALDSIAWDHATMVVRKAMRLFEKESQLPEAVAPDWRPGSMIPEDHYAR